MAKNIPINQIIDDLNHLLNDNEQFSSFLSNNKEAINSLQKVLMKLNEKNKVIFNKNLISTYLKELNRMRSSNYDNFEDLFNEYFTLGSKLLKLPIATLYQITETNKCVVFVSQTDNKKPQLGDTYRLDDTFFSNILDHPKTMFSISNEKSDKIHKIHDGAESYLITPIFAQNNVYGILEFVSYEKRHAFSEAEIEIIEIMASDIGTIITDHLLEIQRNKVKTALYSSQDQLKVLVANIPGAVYRSSMGKARFMDFISDEIKNISGFNASVFIGNATKKFSDIIHEDDLERIKKIIQNAMETKQSYLIDYRVFHKDGSIRWVSERGKVSYETNGTPKYLDGVLFDITERKYAEEQLRLFEAVVLNATDVILIEEVTNEKDGNSKIIFVNNAFTEKYKYKYDEVKGKAPSFLLSKDTGKKSLLKILKSRKKIKPVREETINIDKDGNKHWVDLSIVPVTNYKGECTHWVSFQRDITEKKKAEEKLRRSELRFRRLIQDLHVGVYLQGPNKEILICNQYALELLSLEEYNIIGKNTFSENQTIIKKDGNIFPENEQPANLAYKTKVPIRNVEMGIIKPESKEIVWLLVNAEPSVKTDGEIEYVISSFSDITERRKAEIALKESEERLRSTFASMSDIVIVMNQHGKLMDFHQPDSQTILFYDLQGFLGKHYEEMLPDHVIVILQKAIENAISGKKVQYFDFLLKFDLFEMWYSASVSVRFDITGNFAGVTVIVNDITERITSEKRIIEQKNKLETILRAIPDAVVVEDKNNKISFINDSVGRIFNFKHNKLIKKNSNKLFGEASVISNKQRYSRSIGEYKPIEVALKKKTGEKMICEVIGAPITDYNNKIVGYVNIIRDVTQYRNAEEANRYLASIVESSNDAIIGQNLNNDIVSWNPGAERLYGYLAAEAIGKAVSLIIPFLKKAESKEFLKKIRAGQYIKNHESIRQHKSGENIDVSITISPIYDNTGRINGASTMARDITQQKKLNIILKEKALAEKSLQFKTEFLANMSHEIRTPLNGIIGMTDVLIDTTLTDSQYEYAQTIKSSSHDLLLIINDILDLSKLEAGKMKLRPTIFDIRDTHKKLKELFVPLIQQKNLGFNFYIEDNVPKYIKADESRLTQILTNLISNAITFTSEGKVELFVSLVNVDLIKVKVKDSGIGIPQKQQDKLFQKFFQLDTSSTRVHGGTGLGLAICQELAKLLKGNIGVESKTNLGSTFWFSFKFKTVSQESIENKPDTEITRINKIKFDATILLVEDKKVNQEVAKIILKNAGCKTELAENGQEALDKFEENKYDIILMDVRMPIMDGVVATKLIKEKYKNIPPIIGLSANAMEGDAKKYTDLGMDDYISKPVTYEGLITKLDKWLQFPKSTHSLKTIRNNKVKNTPEELSLNDFNKFSILEREALNAIKKYSDDGGNEITEIYNSFLDEGKSLLKEIHSAYKRKMSKSLGLTSII